MLNHPIRTCAMKHFCERASFKRKREMYAEKDYKESRYEVWDVHYQGGDEESSPDEVLVYESDSKEECEAYMKTGVYELRENGVCAVCDMYDKRQADLKEGKVRPFYLVVSSTSRHYGGPEEGGWWYDNSEVLTVRKAFTFEQGLFHARKLREEYPQPKYNRYSCANRGEGDTRIHLCYGEADPRWPSENQERPRYE